MAQPGNPSGLERLSDNDVEAIDQLREVYAGCGRSSAG